MKTRFKDNLPRREYRVAGYYIARQMFTFERMQGVEQGMYSLFRNQTPGLRESSSLQMRMKFLLSKDPVAYVNTLRTFARLAFVQELMLDWKIRALARRLVLTSDSFATHPPVLNVLSEELQITGGYQGTAAHQDWPSLQGSLDALIVWVPLTSAGFHNYPLQVVQGSHRAGLKQGTAQGSVLAIEPPSEEAFVSLQTEPGDVVFMSAFAIHRTGPAGSEEAFRMALSSRYENVNEPTFIRRGYPSAQQRSVSYTPITPNFPDLEQLQKVFE